MPGHIFIAPGDITQLAADAIGYSASCYLGRDGNLCSSFETNVPGFADWFRDLRTSVERPVDVGETFWRPMHHDGRPQGMVLVISTGHSPELDKAGLAVRNALTRAAQELRGAGRMGRLLIALPAFRVGAGGDHMQRLRSARAQIQAAWTTLEGLDEVDVAFITYTTSLYRIFLEARREIIGPSLPTMTNLLGLERALIDRTCVLFAGAGMSQDAGLPTWNELIERLSHDLSLPPGIRVDHLDLAQWYREQFGAQQLARVLHSTFSATGTPTLAHYLLLALPFRHIITTNYDDLLERSLTALKRHPVPVIRQEDVVHTGGSGVYVVKLHGDASQPEDIVLSRNDYHAFFERRPAMALLLEGLLLNQTFFFVGYSLRDPNFAQIFSRIARMLRESRRPAFASSFDASGPGAEYLQRQWRLQGLELLPIVGATFQEQKRAFLQFLDGLAERVTLQTPPLVLADDVPCSPVLEPVRSLLEQVGEQFTSLCQAEDLSPQDTHFLAQLLHFLTTHGWRPVRNLSQVYENLARRCQDPDLRRRLLIAGLEQAEGFRQVLRLQQRLRQEETAG